MACVTPAEAELKRITHDAADRLRQSLVAGQPVTTKLVVSTLASHLEDKDVVADLARRALMGENVFGALVRTLIYQEAEHIAKATLSAALEGA